MSAHHGVRLIIVTREDNSLIFLGGYPKFVERGYNDDFLPVWLQEAGYNTYYTGKLFNAHTTTNYDSPHVKGFNGSDFLLDPYTYQYLHAHYQRNHNPPIDYTGRHTTDVITEKALGFLDDALASDRPFFVAIAPVAPHSNFEHTRSGLKITAPIPLDRHKKLFTNAIVPRTPNFNPDKVCSNNLIHLTSANCEPSHPDASGSAISPSSAIQTSNTMMNSTGTASVHCKGLMSFLTTSFKLSQMPVYSTIRTSSTPPTMATTSANIACSPAKRPVSKRISVFRFSFVDLMCLGIALWTL